MVFNSKEEEELEEDTELLIGPAPPAIVAEAASANEAERLEEVSKSPVILSSSVFHKFRSRKKFKESKEMISSYSL
ncbi:hypothetical protein NC651_030614 [Populus alba x Populus x berolinensis]|nr:hypothetical protein NC651_030614 [Populus alba x Populus x berolinensis]